MSNLLKLDADSILSKAPLIEKNQNDLRQIFDIISKNGLSVSSVTKIIPLANRIKNNR